MNHGWRRALGGLGLLALLGLGIVFWPAGLGGHVAYVTTRGSSMEPRLHHGDLAIVRPAPRYRVGDVVAYRSRLLEDTTVLHRIVDRDGDRYVLRGDKNPFQDRDRPTDADLTGRLWVHIPKGGLVLGWFRGQLPLVVGLSILLAGATAPRRRHRTQGRHRMQTRSSSHRVPTRAWRAVAIGLGAAAATCTAVGVLAFTRPTVQAATDAIAYTSHGQFAYTAPAPAGPVYDSNIHTGDPIFLHLVRAVDVSFDYRLDSPENTTVAGTLALRAEITGANGWRRAIELGTPTTFDGNESRVSATLDVERIQTIIAEVQVATGVNGGSHIVSVVAEANVHGSMEGQTLDEVFAPRLDFQLDPLQLRLIQPASNPQDANRGDPLAPQQSGSLRRTIDTAAALEALGHSVAITDARRLAVGVGVPAAAAALLALVIVSRRLRGEVARIELRHGHRLVPVAGTNHDAGNAVIEVTSMEDLARLAEQHGRLILHRQTRSGHDFVFQADRVIYRYAARDRPSSRKQAV